jgi:tetratricopeptide (TPR) repeat protein
MHRQTFGYILLGVILGSPLLLTGGNEVLFTVLLGLTVLLSFLFLLKQPLDGALKIPLRLFLAFIGCQILTLIPLPVAWIRWLSPGLHKVLLNFPEIAYHTLSWDAILTMKTLAIYTAAAGVFLVAYHLWEHPLEKVPFVVQLFFWTGTFWVAVSLWLHYTTPGRVPFLPWQPEPWFFGLFTNSNIFGSFCAMLIPLGLVTGGLYFLRRDAMPGAFPIPFLAVGLLCFSIYAARSLGAAIAAGAAVFILLVPGKRFTIPLLHLALALFGQQAAGSLNQPSRKSLESRVQFNRLGLHALVRMPVAGSGLGTMALAGPHFQEPAGTRIVNKLHNDWLELAATAGLSSLLLFLCVGLLARPCFGHLGRQGSLRGGMLAAIIAVGVHSMVDFPLQNLSVLLWACLAAGALARLTSPVTAVPSAWEGRCLRVFLGGGLVVAAMLANGLMRVAQGGSDPWQPYRSMVGTARTEQTMQRLLTGHPLMAGLWGELSRVREGANDFEGALEALRRAVTLQPRNPALRLMEARLRYIGGEEGASGAALSEAFALNPGMGLNDFPPLKEDCGRILSAGARTGVGYYGSDAAGHFRNAYHWMRKNCPGPEAQLAREVVRHLPGSAEAHQLLAYQLLEEGDAEGARRSAGRALAIDREPQGLLLAARAGAALGDRTETMDALKEGLERLGDAPNRWFILSGLRPIEKEIPEESLTLGEQAFRARPDPLVALWVGGQYEFLGRLRKAAEWYEAAIALDPDLDRAHGGYIRMLARTADPRLADAVTRAERRFPRAPWIKAAAAAPMP